MCRRTSAANRALLPVISFRLCPARKAVQRSTQCFGLRCRLRQRLCAVRPHDPPAAKVHSAAVYAAGSAPPGRLRPPPSHTAPLVQRGRHQRDPRRRVSFGNHAHPFGSDPRLAKPSVCHDQLYPPAARRQQLRGPCPKRPVPRNGGALLFIQQPRQRMAQAVLIVAQKIELVGAHSAVPRAGRMEVASRGALPAMTRW